MHHTLFIDIAIIVSTVVAMVLVTRTLRQPAIIAYILAGIIVSPYGFNIVYSDENLAIFSQMGVSFLLFMVGLSLNPRIVRDLGKVSLVTGVGQVVFTSLIGYGIGILLGFDPITSFYVAVALTFSSTIIIMKLLSDRGDLETLYGRIATGFLIVQDVIAMFLLVIVSSIAGGGTWESIVGTTTLRLLALFAMLTGVGLWVMPRLLKAVAASQELLLLFSISWCLAIAALCQVMGLSAEIGALAAGVTLSLSPYRFEIGAKLRPLRDFFIVLFFVLLGSQMVFENVLSQIAPVLIFSAFILIGNPFIVMVLMGLLGYSKRNSFRAGLTVAQISEFSFILVALGVRVGHLQDEILSFVTLVGIVTIAGSTYFILYADTLYKWLSPLLSFFERKGPKADDHSRVTVPAHDILLLGYERIGLNVLEALRKNSDSFMVVDYNPLTIQELTAGDIECEYGDLADSDFVETLNFKDAKMIVSTLSDMDTTILLVRHIRSINPKAILIVVSQKLEHALYLYELGATYVITPQFLSGYHTSLLIEEYGLDLQKFLLEQTRHMSHLETSRHRMEKLFKRK